MRLSLCHKEIYVKPQQNECGTAITLYFMTVNILAMIAVITSLATVNGFGLFLCS